MELDYEQNLDSILSALSAHVENKSRCSVVNTSIGTQASMPGSAVRMRLQQRLTTLTTLYSKLARDANQYTPLYSLPDDLLLAIWDHLPPPDRLHLPAVSQRFREVAFASHRLWRFINISDGSSTDILKVLLTRTGTADLHLYTDDHGEETAQGVSARSIDTAQSPSAQSRTQMIDDALVRCTILTGTINSGSYRSFELATRPPSVSLGILEYMTPRLRSLRLSDVVTLGSSVRHPIPFPLFGGQTRQLLHVHFSNFSPQWDDPLYRNLTYLRLERLISRPSVSQMLHILKGCPNLDHLLLRFVLSAQSDSQHPLPSVALPFLRQLSLVEESSGNIISLIDRLHTNPCLRLGVSSTTFPALTMRCIREDTPWVLISRADELIISGVGFEGSACSVMTKQSGTILTHFCLDLSLSWNAEHTLVDSIQQSSLLFYRIKCLRFQGIFFEAGVTQKLISMFPCLEVLETVNFGIADTILSSVHKMTLTEPPLLEIVGKALCPNLHELRITLAEYNKIEDLIQWLGHRNDLGYQPLRCARVYADQPLNLADGKRMDHLVGNIQWRERCRLFVYRDIYSLLHLKAGTRDGRNDQDEDLVDRESQRAMSVPQDEVPYLGEDPPDYFSIPE